MEKKDAVRDVVFDFQGPSLREEKMLFEGLNKEAFLKKKMPPMKPFGIAVRDQKGLFLGGLKGCFYYGCLYIDLLWVEQEYRGLGLGEKILKEAEKIAEKDKAIFIILATMDWEALGFYQKLGYSIQHVLEGYYNDSKMYIMRKDL